MEAIPRTTRAQAMDALSSQASAAGYAATLIAARESGRFFGMMTTAAGTVPPARVMVLGAGVAGLQAVATAKRLGAIVTGFDIRRAAWEQIASLGGRPLELDFIPDAEGEGGYARPLTDEENAQVRDALTEEAAKQDIIVTTAAIPGRPAPLLITAEAVRGMKPGSVIVDLAAESGGNCELTRAGETVNEDGVEVIGPRNLPSEMPAPASQLYAKNLENLLGLMITEEGALEIDFEDDIIDAACITDGGEIRNERAAGQRESQRRTRSDDPDDRDHDLRPRRLRRLRGDLEGPDHPAHAPDVPDERDPRDRHARRPDRRRLRRRPARVHHRRDRDRLRDDQRRRRVHGHRPDAGDVREETETPRRRRTARAPGRAQAGRRCRDGALHRRLLLLHLRRAARHPSDHREAGQPDRRRRDGGRGRHHPASRRDRQLGPDRARAGDRRPRSA